MKRIIYFFVAFLLTTTMLYSQTVPGPFDINSFSDLNDRRTKLNILIPELENQLSDLNFFRGDSLSIQRQIDYNERFLKQNRDRLSSIPAADTPLINKIQTEIDYEDQRKTSLLNDLKDVATNNLKRVDLQKQIDIAKSDRNNVEYKINQLMIPKLSQQNFMFWASIAFVVLMCFLLFTFFKVVDRDDGVRKMIFGSDSGIQFITLFSIVIAIILFGLTGVLEGKELSALLGSVAGYILGKTNVSSGKSDNNNINPTGDPGPNPPVNNGPNPPDNPGSNPPDNPGSNSPVNPEPNPPVNPESNPPIKPD